MNTSFEAWLDRVQPIEKAEPIYQATTTVFTFTVLDSARNAVNLTGYVAKFAAKGIDDDEIKAAPEARVYRRRQVGPGG